MRRIVVSALILAGLVGVSTSGCLVGAGDDRDGWRRRDRDRWEDRRDGRDGRWEHRDGRWEWRQDRR